MARRTWTEVTAAQEAVLRTLLDRLPDGWTPIEHAADLLAMTLDALQDVTASDAARPDWATDPSALLGKLWADGLIEVRVRRQRYGGTHELLDAGRDDRRDTRFTADGLVTSRQAGIDPEHRLKRRIVFRHPHGDPEPVVTLGYDAEIRRTPAPALTDYPPKRQRSSGSPAATALAAATPNRRRPPVWFFDLADTLVAAGVNDEDPHCWSVISERLKALRRTGNHRHNVDQVRLAMKFRRAEQSQRKE